MDASTQALRRDGRQQLCALARTRLPAERHAAFEAFAAGCF